jgi:LTXXQ motif family protein
VTGASKLFIVAAAILAMAIARPVEAGHEGGGGHGGGSWHGGGWGWHSGGWHGGSGWHEAAGWHDNGRHLGWYKHGSGGAGWGGTFASAQFGHGWGGPGFGGPGGIGWWDWRHAWAWNDSGWGWGAGAWGWGGPLVGASFGPIVAPPLIVAPPPIYIAPPPIVLGLPAIAPPPIAAGPPPPAPPPAVAAPLPPSGALLGAALPPPVVVLPPPAIVVAAAPPLVVLTPPAFGLFIGPPVLAFATIGPGWWHGGFITGGFGAVGATAIAHFGRRTFAGEPVGFHGRLGSPSRPAWGGAWHGGWGGRGWHGGGFGGWRGAGGCTRPGWAAASVAAAADGAEEVDVFGSFLARGVALAVFLAPSIGLPQSAAPLPPTAAPPAPAAPAAAPSSSASAPSAATQAAVDQRIKMLQSQLGITEAQMPLWSAFTQAMRENAAATDALFAVATMNAPDNMHSYAEIARGYADNTERLATAFDSLYASLSDTQKQAADTMFRQQAPAAAQPRARR